MASQQFEDSVDGIMLVQRYIQAPAPFITRVEFVRRRLVYAVRVDTSQGFRLCPADACQVVDASVSAGSGARRQISDIGNFSIPLVPAWQAFLASNDIGIAGIEFIEDALGVSYTYDINTNTNYNAEAEAKDGRRGMQAIALHLKQLLVERYGRAIAIPSAA